MSPLIHQVGKTQKILLMVIISNSLCFRVSPQKEIKGHSEFLFTKINS